MAPRDIMYVYKSIRMHQVTNGKGRQMSNELGSVSWNSIGRSVYGAVLPYVSCLGTHCSGSAIPSRFTLACLAFTLNYLAISLSRYSSSKFMNSISSMIHLSFISQSDSVMARPTGDCFDCHRSVLQFQSCLVHLVHRNHSMPDCFASEQHKRTCVTTHRYFRVDISLAKLE